MKERFENHTLNDKEIFGALLDLGEKNLGFDGVVTACIVRKGKILFIAPSIIEGVIIHAEQNVLGFMYRNSIPVKPTDTLYTTLEPCSGRFDSTGGAPDCTTLIIESGIKNVVYGASDPVQTLLTHKRFAVANINVRQTRDRDSIERSKELFNSPGGDYKI
jgi:pyrimidine deaminase RibD-like protein